MAYVVLKGERKIGDVVARAYGDLRAADAKRAEAALVRANPQLGNLREVRPGAVIVVPAVPGLRPAASADRADQPAAEAVAELRDALEDYRKRLGTRIGDEKAAIAALGELLKSKEVKTVVRDFPDAAAHVERVGAALKPRAAENDARAAFAKTLTKAKADLDALAKKLG
ncbi:MAG: hypothetical protein KJ025_02825 [Burkholderiales bacterium]|nr:hypothetical protein [Burkholderiales bacterium]